MTNKTIVVGKEGEISLKSFKHLVDIKKVVYYEFKIKNKKKGTIILSLFDKNKQLIKPKE